MPLLQDVFFEFINADGEVRLLHELYLDEVYEIVITTFGGLFRYRLGDQVKVSGFYKKTPSLEFVGRAGDICDMAGEKLSEWAIRDIFKNAHIDVGFYLVVPDLKSHRYILFSEKPAHDQAVHLDAILQGVFHYRVARDQGQLQPLECRTSPNLRSDYFKWLEKRNMRRGDIKEKALLANLSLAQSFLNFAETDPRPPSPSVQAITL
jgi:hypothetical protein